MSKNNKKTMNERTHNSFGVYKNMRNTNSNTNDAGENRTSEFGMDFNEQTKERPDRKK